MLSALGATDVEDRVYEWLVAAVSASEDEIVQATGLAVDDVRAALSSLIASGLTGRMEDSPTRFVAASPGLVESMISEKLVALRQAQEALTGLSLNYRAASLARAAGSVFEVIRGGEALRERSLHLMTSARSEVLNFVKPPLIAVQPEERIGPSPSVRNRIIYETSALEDQAVLDGFEDGVYGRDEVRVHTKLPIKMLAVDRRSALLPLAQDDTTPVGVLVHESAVLDALLVLFEYVWAAAIPLHVSGIANGRPHTPSKLSEEDRTLLSLLLAGLSDEAIARYRKQSVRTVQRRVRALMSLANVGTRMQLAWEAARQRWV